MLSHKFTNLTEKRGQKIFNIFRILVGVPFLKTNQFIMNCTAFYSKARLCILTCYNCVNQALLRVYFHFPLMIVLA